MNAKKLAIFALVTVIALTIYIGNVDIDEVSSVELEMISGQATPERSDTNPEKSSVSTSEGTKSSIEPVANPAKSLAEMSAKELEDALRSNSIDCTTADSLDSDPQIEAYTEFSRDFILMTYEKLKPYSVYNENELLALANEDPLAQYVLGLNYRWYANNSTFLSPKIMYDKPQGLLEPKDAYDDDSMDKSEEWLFKAAINGYPSAFIEIAQTLNDRISSLNRHFDMVIKSEDRTEHDANIKRLSIRRAAIYRLFLDIIPELGEYDDDTVEQLNKELEEFDNEELEEFNTTFASLTEKWETGRSGLGLSFTHNLSHSLEDTDTGSLKFIIRSYCKHEAVN